MNSGITIDGDTEHAVYSPVCTFCRHLMLGKLRACDAFPDGIPFEIWDGKNDHRKPFEGDRGIQFQPIDVKA